MDTQALPHRLASTSDAGGPRAWLRRLWLRRTLAELSSHELAPLRWRYVHYECLLGQPPTPTSNPPRRRVTCPERLRAAGL